MCGGGPEILEVLAALEVLGGLEELEQLGQLGFRNALAVYPASPCDIPESIKTARENKKPRR